LAEDIGGLLFIRTLRSPLGGISGERRALPPVVLRWDLTSAVTRRCGEMLPRTAGYARGILHDKGACAGKSTSVH